MATDKKLKSCLAPLRNIPFKRGAFDPSEDTDRVRARVREALRCAGLDKVAMVADDEVEAQGNKATVFVQFTVGLKESAAERKARVRNEREWVAAMRKERRRTKGKTVEELEREFEEQWRRDYDKYGPMPD